MAVVSPRPLPDRPTVIVLRALPGLGDWLCAVPTLRAIRAARPEARIHLVGLPATRGLVGRYPELIDGFHAFPGWPGLPERTVDIAAIPGFLAGLQGLDADIAIQLHGSGEMTNELIELFGSRNVAGYYRADARCPDPTRFLTWREGDPEVRRGLRLLALLGIDGADERLAFPIDPSGQETATALLDASGVRGRFVVIHPGCRRPADRWSATAFASVGRELARLGWTVVITGDESEAALTKEVVAGVPGAVDLAGLTTLDSMAGVLTGSSLVITNDTGVSHLADALHVRSLVVFANDDGTRAARWAPLDRRLHVPVVPDPSEPPDATAMAVTARAREALRLRDRTLRLPASHGGAVA